GFKNLDVLTCDRAWSAIRTDQRRRDLVFTGRHTANLDSARLGSALPFELNSAGAVEFGRIGDHFHRAIAGVRVDVRLDDRFGGAKREGGGSGKRGGMLR